MKDILDEMTKEEIIRWLRNDMGFFLRKPKRSDVLFLRWQIKTKTLQERRDANSKYLNSLNLAKRDEYAKRFNASKDSEEKILMLKKMAPYNKKLEKYFAESKALMAADRRLDKLYAQIDIERQKESQGRG